MNKLAIPAMLAMLIGTSIGVCYSINTTLIDAARIAVRGKPVVMKVIVDDDHGVICWMTSAGGVFCMPLSWLPSAKAPANTAPAVPRDQAREL